MTDAIAAEEAVDFIKKFKVNWRNSNKRITQHDRKYCTILYCPNVTQIISTITQFLSDDTQNQNVYI